MGPARRRGRASYAGAVGLALVLLAGGCADQGDADPAPSGASPSASTATNGSVPSSATTSAQTGLGDPEVLTPTADPLDWRPAPGPAADTTTVSGKWRLSVAAAGDTATLTGPLSGRAISVDAGPRGRITAAELSEAWALVVVSDKQEQRPAVATVIDLQSGRRLVVDGSSAAPTVSGGTWALGDGQILHATYGPKRAYCLASVSLPSLAAQRLWCAPPRQGFTNARLAAGGPTVMAFDDSHPSCRTVATPVDGQLQPFAGPPKCKAWEGVALADGQVWSVIEHENQIETAHFFASADGHVFDLGPGKSGTLLACGGAAYFARDPQTDDGPAQILRWSDAGGLAVVFEWPAGGPTYVGGAPRCGGTDLTITTLADSGDRQLTAALG